MHDDSNPYASPTNYADRRCQTSKPKPLFAAWLGWFLLCDAIFSVLVYVGAELPLSIVLFLDMLYMEAYWLPIWWSPITVAALGLMFFHRKTGAAVGYLVGAGTLIWIVGDAIRVIGRVLTYPTVSPVTLITHIVLGSALRIAWNIAYLYAVRVGVGRRDLVPPKSE